MGSGEIRERVVAARAIQQSGVTIMRTSRRACSANIARLTKRASGPSNWPSAAWDSRPALMTAFLNLRERSPIWTSRKGCRPSTSLKRSSIGAWTAITGARLEARVATGITLDRSSELRGSTRQCFRSGVGARSRPSSQQSKETDFCTSDVQLNKRTLGPNRPISMNCFLLDRYTKRNENSVPVAQTPGRSAIQPEGLTPPQPAPF